MYIMSVSWDENFDLLQRYVAKHNYIPIYGVYTTSAHRDLGTWGFAQYISKESLSDDQVSKLESISKWEWPSHAYRDPYYAQWVIIYSLLVQTARRIGKIPDLTHGTCVCLLGCWVHKQRVRHESNELEQPMIDALEKIPEWVWHPEYSWDEYKIFTTGFIRRYGRMPRRDDMFHTARIGRWVAKQLDDEICGRITTAHYAELDSIENFTWNVRLMVVLPARYMHKPPYISKYNC